jgi:hypothetical protein
MIFVIAILHFMTMASAAPLLRGSAKQDEIANQYIVVFDRFLGSQHREDHFIDIAKRAGELRRRYLVDVSRNNETSMASTFAEVLHRFNINNWHAYSAKLSPE